MNDWMARGACRGEDPELFFPTRGESLRAPRAVCARCEVRDECREYALADPELLGVWGGLSVREREQIRRDRQRAGRAA